LCAGSVFLLPAVLLIMFYKPGLHGLLKKFAAASRLCFGIFRCFKRGTDFMLFYNDNTYLITLK